MPTTLLPASAAAFAPRASPNVVLNSKVDPWLTATLKRINRIKRPLNSAPQHQRCLTETLSSQSAIWTLCSLMLPKAPESELRKDPNPLVEGLFNYQMIHIEAYVVHVDMVSQNEIAFKLTPETIESLIEYHTDIYSIDIAANTWNWSEKTIQLKKLQEEFVQAANKFVYLAPAVALEGLEEDGAGELLCGRGEEVKNAIMAMFVPLLPPPPRIVDVIRPTPILPSSPGVGNWWQQSSISPPHPVPVESWKVLSSSPSPPSSTESNPAMWTSMGMTEAHIPSPTTAYSPPYSTSGQYSNTLQVIAPIPQLPLPSVLMQQQCSTSAGYGGFAWDRYQEYTLPYATTM